MTAVHLDILKEIRIASPCNMGWDDMHGDDRKRHCEQCDLDVHNIEAMTREEFERLVLGADGRVCARIRRRVDGTLILRDCPVGIAAVRARVRHGAARAVAFASFLFTASVLYARGNDNPWPEARLFHLQPFKWMYEQLRQAPPLQPSLMGEMCTPLTPTLNLDAPIKALTEAAEVVATPAEAATKETIR